MRLGLRRTLVANERTRTWVGYDGALVIVCRTFSSQDNLEADQITDSGVSSGSEENLH